MQAGGNGPAGKALVLRLLYSMRGFGKSTGAKAHRRDDIAALPLPGIHATKTAKRHSARTGIMAGATKGSKRSRNSEESPAPAALPASSAAAAPPSPSVNSTGQRPLSAVAARRAAREASLATPHVARPAQTATTSSSAPRSATKVPATELNSHPDSSPDEQVGSDADSDAASSSDNALERRPEPPLRKKSKTAARYFAAEEKRPHARRAATTGGGGDFMMLEDAETSVAEPDNGNESSEAATPRSSRRRREKPCVRCTRSFYRKFLTQLYLRAVLSLIRNARRPSSLWPESTFSRRQALPTTAHSMPPRSSSCARTRCVLTC